MHLLRTVFATILFCTSSYLVYDLFANGFDLIVLLFCIGGYLLSHYILPEKKSATGDWFDILDLVIDLPYRLIALAIRSIARLIRSSDGDIGIDL
jgi:hypothetical protein